MTTPPTDERLFIRNLAAACVVLIGIASAIFYWRLFALGSIMATEGVAPPGRPPVWYAFAMMAPHAAIVALFSRTPTGFAWGFAHNVAAVTIFALPAMVVLMPGVLLVFIMPDAIARIYPVMAAALLVGTVLQ